MANRTWLAVALCCLVIYGWNRWFVPQVPVTAPPAASSVAAGTVADPSKPSLPPSLSQGSGIPVGNPTSPFAAKPVFTESAKLTNAAREVLFSAGGGKPGEIHLLEFNQTLQKDSPKIESLDPKTEPHTMGALFTEPVLSPLGYQPYAAKSVDGKVVFQHNVAGVQVTKTFTAGEGEYFLNQQIDIHFPAGDRGDWGYVLIPVGGVGLVPNHEDPLRAWEAIAYQNDSITRKKIEDIKEGSEILQGNTKWVAFGNRYFANTIVNESPINPDVVFEKHAEFGGVYLRFPLLVKSGARDIQLKFKLYSGPKEYSELAKVPGMKQLIDYGMFSFLAYPMLELLRFFYKFLHNFGLAIILLTLVVRVLFYPLSLKSYKSMKAMQRLQPQINALKEKYKDDAQKFGAEQMALFRQNKVNPAGGCLPVLVQLPVFIALYALLQNSIELFHAPFFGWIKDLSSKDPFYIFPVLMGISMFVQQKMTPAAGMDPMQQKILLLMPVIFSFVMISLPSGLTMYIFVSTLLGILQQVLMNREQKKPNGQPLVTAPQPTQGK